jgi:hypothetical protein
MGCFTIQGMEWTTAVMFESVNKNIGAHPLSTRLYFLLNSKLLEEAQQLRR